MKFTIAVLLGLCALVSAGGSVARPGNQVDIPDVYATGSNLLENIQKQVDELIKKGTQDADVVVQKVKELVQKVQEELVALGKNIKGKLEAVKAEIFSKVNDIKQKGGAVKQCAEPLVAEIEKIEKEAGSDFEACAKEVSDEYKKFEETVHKDVEDLKTDVVKFSEEVKECFSWNLLDFIKCAQAKMGLFQSLLKGFKDTSLDALSIGRDVAAEAVKEVHSCNKALAKKAALNIQAVQQKFMQCYKQ